ARSGPAMTMWSSRWGADMMLLRPVWGGYAQPATWRGHCAHRPCVAPPSEQRLDRLAHDPVGVDDRDQPPLVEGGAGMGEAQGDHLAERDRGLALPAQEGVLVVQRGDLGARVGRQRSFLAAEAACDGERDGQALVVGDV